MELASDLVNSNGNTGWLSGRQVRSNVELVEGSFNNRVVRTKLSIRIRQVLYGLGLLQAKLVSEKSMELQLTCLIGSARGGAGGTSSSSASETVSTTGVVALILLSPAVAIGSGGTGGGTGGMRSGGTI